ncbi:hypothetical protein ACFZAI_22195 [Achromobacter sp. NPDC008082]|uniref:hypothetical protein n=1 Tax=Achromobacter sp. NPDC008082 TaxID=3363888 RepID=UPI0036EA5766
MRLRGGVIEIVAVVMAVSRMVVARMIVAFMIMARMIVARMLMARMLMRGVMPRILLPVRMPVAAAAGVALRCRGGLLGFDRRKSHRSSPC